MCFHCCDFPSPFLQLLRRYHLPLYFPFDCLNFSSRRNWMGSNLEHFHTKQAKLKHSYEKQTKRKLTIPEVLGSCRNAVKLFCKRFRVQLGQALWRRRRQEKAETFCWIESHKSLHNFHSGSYTGWFFNWPPPKNVSRRIQGAPNKKNHLITDIQSCSFLFSKSCIHIKAHCRQLFTPII